jgi:hypothetical protein
MHACVGSGDTDSQAAPSASAKQTFSLIRRTNSSSIGRRYHRYIEDSAFILPGRRGSKIFSARRKHRGAQYINTKIETSILQPGA